MLNMIAFHALALVALGRWTPKLHRAYTLFYVIGTWGAIQVPVVGLTPLKSLEQLGALGVFGIIQLMWISSVVRTCVDPNNTYQHEQIMKLRASVFGVAAMIGAVVVSILAGRGYFGPLSSRVRGLFVQHTRTGNPLVDSVAEHQPALLRPTCRWCEEQWQEFLTRNTFRVSESNVRSLTASAIPLGVAIVDSKSSSVSL